MTVEEYRQRMINAFHNADCDNLIALVALPTKKEFEHLEWLLKNHYHNQEQEPCEDAVSRQAVLDKIYDVDGMEALENSNIFAKHYANMVKSMPSITPQPKTGHWIFDEILDRHYYCSECKSMGVVYWDYCPNCGARMVDE